VLLKSQLKEDLKHGSVRGVDNEYRRVKDAYSTKINNKFTRV
jgi:hypothetical protein